MSSFKTTFSNKNIDNSKASFINKIIEYSYSQNFHEILLKDKSDFISNIESQILSMLN